MRSLPGVVAFPSTPIAEKEQRGVSNFKGAGPDPQPNAANQEFARRYFDVGREGFAQALGF
eukprot:14232085-Alexandrium_andersonii.AAC.1